MGGGGALALPSKQMVVGIKVRSAKGKTLTEKANSSGRAAT